MPEQEPKSLPTVTIDPVSVPYRRFDFGFLAAFLLAIGLFISIGMNLFLIAKNISMPDTYDGQDG